MPRILKNIRIDEVSAVTKGAGEGTRIVLMKRHDDDFDEWHREQAAIAERMNEEHLRKHAPTWRSFNEVLAERTAKSFAADALGDEATREDEATPVDELDGDDSLPSPDGTSDGVPKKHRSITFDTIAGERMKFPDERSLAEWLAIQSRIRKSTSEESNSMSTTPEEKLSDLVKRAGITAVAAQIVKADSAFSIDEHTLTQLTIEHAKREHPQLTDAQAFAKVYSAQDEGGVILRKAFNVVKAAGAAPYFDLKPQFVGGEDALDVDDPSKAIAQLTEIGRQKWPTASEAQQFENAFTDPANAELSRKAYRRPAATSIYPFPK